MFRVRKQLFCHTEYTGKNVTAAILDTGIAKHPDFSQRIVAFADFVNKRNGIYDDEGHGTHVAGILGGDGRLSNGRYQGIAPDCNLVIGKILDGSGDGTIEYMLQGMEWVLKNQKALNIRILNISVGMGLSLKGTRRDELIASVEEAWNRGIVVVAAAGNAGPMPGTLSPLGTIHKIITVGCHDGGYFGRRDSLCEQFSGEEAKTDLEENRILLHREQKLFPVVIACIGHEKAGRMFMRKKQVHPCQHQWFQELQRFTCRKIRRLKMEK